jgi:hypothetical protein
LQAARDTAHCGGYLFPYLCQRGGGVVFYTPEFIEDGIYLSDQLREHHNITGESCQGGIFDLFSLFHGGTEETDDVVDSLE